MRGREGEGEVLRGSEGSGRDQTFQEGRGRLLWQDDLRG